MGANFWLSFEAPYPLAVTGRPRLPPPPKRPKQAQKPDFVVFFKFSILYLEQMFQLFPLQALNPSGVLPPLQINHLQITEQLGVFHLPDHQYPRQKYTFRNVYYIIYQKRLHSREKLINNNNNSLLMCPIHSNCTCLLILSYLSSVCLLTGFEPCT